MQSPLNFMVPAEIRASDIGTRAGLFEVQKIGDEFFAFVVDCDKPKACSIVLRGASKVVDLTQRHNSV